MLPKLRDMHYWASRPFTLQTEGLRVMFAKGAKIKKYISIPAPNGYRTSYLPQKEFSNAINTGKKIVINNPRQHFLEYQEQTKNLRQKAKNLACKKNVKAYLEWLTALEEYWLPVMIPFTLEYLIEPELRVKLPYEFEQIITPPKMTYFDKMRKGILKIALAKNRSAKERIAEILERKFHWYSTYSLRESLLNKNYFLSQAKEFSMKKAQKELEKFKFRYKYYKGDKIHDTYLKNAAKISNMYATLRTERVEILNKATSKLRPFYFSIAKKYELSYEDTINITNDEMIRLLREDKLPQQIDLIKRRKGDYVYYHDRKDHFYYGSEAQKIIKQLEKSFSQNITGTCACAGQVKGIIKIINSKDDLKYITPDHILVAAHTMPEYIVGMQKAKAIITNEGGLSSHAAIISRELNKPCIIGTKIATKVFKDGDMVEVDANKGIVRKITEKK